MTGLRPLLARPAPQAAPAVLGSILVVGSGDGTVSVRIDEVEAYTEDDPASHSFRGRTPRNASMFGPPGTLYVYRSYGVHWCANVATGGEGRGDAILLRGGTVQGGRDLAARRRGRTDHLTDGPGKLCQALGITGADDGADLLAGGRIRLEPGPPPPAVRATPRIGISRAAHRPWRFLAAEPAGTDG